MDEKASTTIGFFCRARAFTATITSLDPRHQRTRPYTPRHNGKVEHYNHILAKECPYARPYSSQQQRRDAVAVQNHHYNYHRPHTTCHNQPPASQHTSPTSWPHTPSRHQVCTSRGMASLHSQPTTTSSTTPLFTASTRRHRYALPFVHQVP